MTSILGVTRKISDTIRPIWMKLWGFIEFTLKLCNVIFSTSGLDLETGNWNFLEMWNFSRDSGFSRYWNISKLILNNFEYLKVQLKDPKFAAIWSWVILQIKISLKYLKERFIKDQLFNVNEVLFINKFHILCSIFFIEIYVGVLVNINRFAHMNCVGEFIFENSFWCVLGHFQ